SRLAAASSSSHPPPGAVRRSGVAVRAEARRLRASFAAGLSGCACSRASARRSSPTRVRCRPAAASGATASTLARSPRDRAGRASRRSAGGVPATGGGDEVFLLLDTHPPDALVDVVDPLFTPHLPPLPHL